VAVLWVAQNGFTDDVPVEQVKDFQQKLTEYLTTRRAELLARIQKEAALSDALTAELKAAATEFKQTYKVPAQAPTAAVTQPATAAKAKAATAEPAKKASK
jgi:F-type H+-transporting ATPase subunit alpha